MSVGSLRSELLSFAVVHCTPDMIEPILRAKNLLQTQVCKPCLLSFPLNSLSGAAFSSIIFPLMRLQETWRWWVIGLLTCLGLAGGCHLSRQKFPWCVVSWLLGCWLMCDWLVLNSAVILTFSQFSYVMMIDKRSIRRSFMLCQWWLTGMPRQALLMWQVLHM